MPRGRWVSASHKSKNKWVGEAFPGAPRTPVATITLSPQPAQRVPDTEVGAGGSRCLPLHRAPENCPAVSQHRARNLKKRLGRHVDAEGGFAAT